MVRLPPHVIGLNGRSIGLETHGPAAGAGGRGRRLRAKGLRSAANSLAREAVAGWLECGGWKLPHGMRISCVEAGRPPAACPVCVGLFAAAGSLFGFLVPKG